MPAVLSLLCALAVDLKVCACFGRRDKNLQVAFAVIKHEGFAQHNVFQGNLFATKEVSGCRGSEIEMGRARHNHDMKDLVLGQKWLQLAADARDELGSRQGRREPASQQRMAGVFSCHGNASVLFLLARRVLESLSCAALAACNENVLVKGAVCGIWIAGKTIKAV